ncbi:MAG TPA: amidohydrolase family protein [Terrimesophilobacter sp.]|nr:amidohydrolase family protein [Terrimesophilobacter sp.]
MNHQRDYALKGVSVLDGTGAPPQHDAVVTTEEGRIAAVLDRRDYRPQAGVIELDLDGYWCLPGLIDAHVHLAGGRAGIDDQELGVVAEPPIVRAMRSVADAQAILKRGFSAVRDISWNGLYLKRIFAEQRIPGPKVIACGPGLTRTGGHADLHQFTEEYVDTHGVFGMLADGTDGMVKAVRRLLREGADAIKIFVSGGDNWPHDRNADVHYSLAELRAAIEEAHRQTGTIVLCHAENPTAIRLAIEAGADTIEHGEGLDDDLIALMIERGIILVPTLELIVNWQRDFMPVAEGARAQMRPDAFLYRDHYDRPSSREEGRAASAAAVASYRRALAAGVKIALGSDTVYEPLTPYGEYSAREFTALVQHGMSVEQAIVAATSVAAESLGMSHVIGTIEAGKQADLIVVRDDPRRSADVLYNPDNIHLTFCDGALTVVDGQFVW